MLLSDPRTFHEKLHKLFVLPGLPRSNLLPTSALGRHPPSPSPLRLLAGVGHLCGENTRGRGLGGEDGRRGSGKQGRGAPRGAGGKGGRGAPRGDEALGVRREGGGGEEQRRPGQEEGFVVAARRPPPACGEGAALSK